MSKSIGIVGTNLGDNPRVGVDCKYINFFRQFGNAFVIDARQDGVVNVDLLVLPGGPDVNTYRYGQAPSEDCGNFSNQLDRFDTVVLPKYIEAKIPIFGICRGLQTLNVLFGGTLHQNIWTPISRPDEGEEVHFVKIYGENKVIPCGSNHHQAIDKLGDGFSVTMEGYGGRGSGKSFEPDMEFYLNIEGIKHDKLPIQAVQMHPEKSYCFHNSRALVNYCSDTIKGMIK